MNKIMQNAWFFLCNMQVLCKLLAMGLANKTKHDIMHAGAWRGEAFLYIWGELGLCSYNMGVSVLFL